MKGDLVPILKFHRRRKRPEFFRRLSFLFPYMRVLEIFFTLFLLFARVFPVIAQAETKSILRETGSQAFNQNQTVNEEPVAPAEPEVDSNNDSEKENENC